MSLLERVNIPEGKRGHWTVERFDIPVTSLAFTYGARAPRPGTYTRLMYGNSVVMSDTDAEMRDHYEAVYRAQGHCLINGLGIGMVLNACLLKTPRVDKITVIEIDPDVIALVGPAYQDARVEIVCSSAFDYKPPKGIRYGMVWHDIWNDLCTDNLPEMHKLHRKYGRICDWQGSWGRPLIERQARARSGRLRVSRIRI